MSKYNLNWYQTELQFLEAILLATGGEGSAPLQEILLMADAIDGTVFTLKEVEQALEKLLAAQFVSIQKNKISLTPRFLSLYETIADTPDEKAQLGELLQNQELTTTTIDEAKAILKKYKLKNYYQQYQEQFGG